MNQNTKTVNKTTPSTTTQLQTNKRKADNAFPGDDIKDPFIKDTLGNILNLHNSYKKCKIEVYTKYGEDIHEQVKSYNKTALENVSHKYDKGMKTLLNTVNNIEQVSANTKNKISTIKNQISIFQENKRKVLLEEQRLIALIKKKTNKQLLNINKEENKYRELLCPLQQEEDKHTNELTSVKQEIEEIQKQKEIEIKNEEIECSKRTEFALGIIKKYNNEILMFQEINDLEKLYKLKQYAVNLENKNNTFFSNVLTYGKSFFG